MHRERNKEKEKHRESKIHLPEKKKFLRHRVNTPKAEHF